MLSRNALALFTIVTAMATNQSACEAGGRTACTGPDPSAARIEFETLSGGLPEMPGDRRLRIVGIVRNDGGADFDATAGAQSIVLYEGRRVLAEHRFARLAAGEEIRVTVELALGAGESDGPAEYALAILYDPDIYNDGRPENDDCNRNNNRIQAAR
jgi:hypothetical protein